SPAAGEPLEQLLGHLGVDRLPTPRSGKPAGEAATGKATRKTTAGEAGLLRASEAVLVVVRLLLGVAQNVVSLLHLLVGGVGGLVAGVAVRVILLRQLAVSLLDLVR